jgi:ABC-type Fe3+ transport system substrate-binding protein
VTEVLVFAPRARADAARTLLARACGATGLTVQLEVFGSSGSLFQRLRARRAPPPPDVVMWYGPYAAHSATLSGLLAPIEAQLPPGAAHDPNWTWVGVEFQAFSVSGNPALSSFEQLASVKRLALPDPERSEVGMMALLATLDRTRQSGADVESAWQWWTERVRAGADLLSDESAALSALADSRNPASHALTLQDVGSPLAGLAPVPHALSIPTGGRSPEAAQQLLSWLVSEDAARPNALSAWLAASNGLQTLLAAAPPLDVDWGTREYAAARARWAQNAFTPVLPRS